MTLSKDRFQKTDFFWLLLILAPVVIYLAHAIQFAPEIFYGDDFDLLYPILLAPEAESWQEKWRLWYTQQNEHRILVPRLVTYLCYKAEGFINWPTVALVANLFWVGTLYFFWKAFQSLKLSLWLFAPIPFLLLQPQYFENVIWPISILQQSTVLFWLSFSIFLYAKGRYKMAIIPGIFAIFTHGSGLSIIPVISLLILLEKRWTLLKFWIPLVCFTLAFYFYGLHEGQGASIGESLSQPTRLIFAFFAFLGGITRVFLENPIWAGLAGFVMVAILSMYLFPRIFLQLKSTEKKLGFFDTVLMGNVAILVLAALLVSVARSWAGIESILPARYLHNPAFFACLAYLVSLRIFSSNKRIKVLGGIVLAAALFFNATSYIVNRPSLEAHYNKQLAEETNFINLGFFPQYHWTFNRNIKERHEKALDKGFIRMEKRLPDISGSYATDTTDQIRFSLVFQPSKGEVSNRKEGLLWVQGNNTATDHSYLYLQPDSGPGYWIALKKARPAFKAVLTGKGFTGRHVNAFIPYENLLVGDYKTGILKDGKFFWIDQQLKVENDSLTVF